jgi:hypothetical protein
MLSPRQLLMLVVLGVAFWAVAAAQIRWMPASLTDSLTGAITFVMSLPAGWLSVWITRRCASLTPGQLPAGILISGAIAMMIDGAVLHWAPQVYGGSDTTVRLGAAWLLWGYGAAFAIAFLIYRPSAADAHSVSTAARRQN